MKENLKSLQHVRDRLRVLKKSIHTERQYVTWIRRYVAFCNREIPDKTQWRHPKEYGRQEVEAFLTHLAASTQN